MRDLERKQRSTATERRYRAVALALALLICLSVTTGSLWIDEFSTATIAAQSSPLAALRYATTHLGSEALMPAWVVIVNIAGHVLGRSALALRALNAIWLAIAVLLVSRVGPQRTNLGPAMALAILPFDWYYGNQARPYALQLLMGATFLLAAWQLYVGALRAKPRIEMTRARWLMVFAVVASVLVSLTAAIVVLAMWFAFIVLLRVSFGRWEFTSYSLVGLAIGSVPPLGWYGWLVLHGVSGAKLWSVGLSNVVFAAYEVAGFAGLGPGRIALRSAGLRGLGAVVDSLRPDAPWLAIHGLLILAALGLIAWRASSDRRPMGQGVRRFVTVSIIASLGGAVTLLAAALVAGFPVWGRHFAPMVPVLAGTIGLAGQWTLQESHRGRVIARVVVWALVVSLSVSSGLVRLDPKNRVEDYRNAVALAGKAETHGFRVAWFADARALTYYHDELASNGGIAVGHLPVADSPTLVLVSKPDIFDPSGKVAALVQSGRATRCRSPIRGFGVLVAHSTNNQKACRSIGLANAK